MTVLEIAGLVLVGVPLALLWLAAGFSVLCLAFSPGPGGALTVEQLVQRCEGLSGWALVERAQREVHAAMPGYGFCNGFDTPRQALARRRGICWHRAAVLASVLRAHGIEVRPVHAFLNRFEGGLVSGHAWLEVRIPGEMGVEVRTVCPDDASNTPGVARFRPITRERPFGPGMVALSAERARAQALRGDESLPVHDRSVPDDVGRAVGRAPVHVQQCRSLAGELAVEGDVGGADDRPHAIGVVEGGQPHEDVHLADRNELGKQLVGEDRAHSQRSLNQKKS